MTLVDLTVCLCIAFILYTYVIYPVATAVAASVAPRKIRRAPLDYSVSIVVAARNEQHTIGRRMAEFSAILDRRRAPGEIILVSDGSTDRTAAEARAAVARGIRILELPRNGGKAAALNIGVAQARHEILVFADARQHWAEDALERLLENFADPHVGAVSGDLAVEDSQGVMAGVGLYWRYEKWIRRNESRLGSLAGATGAISAVRRELFRKIPEDLVVEDVYWPLQVAMQGYRVVHDDRAVAFDRWPACCGGEFRRKVRTLSGNFQLLGRIPGALLPWRSRVWVSFVSHKLLRLAIPWALLALFIATAAASDNPWHGALLALQVGFYSLAAIGTAPRTGRIAGASAAFAMLNGAAWLAFWVWLFGASSKSWRAVAYSPPSALGVSGATSREAVA